MRTLRIVSCDPFLTEEVVSALASFGEFTLLSSFSSCSELLESELEKTDILLLDMDLPSQQSWELLEILHALPLVRRSTVFLVCRQLGEASLRYLADKMTYCFLRPVSAPHIAETVVAFADDDKREDRVDDEHCGASFPFSYTFADTLISHALTSLGMPPHLLGYHALREAIKLVLFAQNATRLSTMKDLYPAVSALCGCSTSQAEHAMRHAIDTAWMRAPLPALQNWFGYTTPAHRPTPSNSAFIHTLANGLRASLHYPDEE